jgi:hypothetical protein
MTEHVIVKSGLSISKWLSCTLNVIFSQLGYVIMGNKIVDWVLYLALEYFTLASNTDKISDDEIKITPVLQERHI